MPDIAAADTHAETPVLHVGPTMALPGLLREFGMNPTSVLRDAGLDVRVFSDPDSLLASQARGRLLEFCVERTGCGHFGLLVGSRAGLASLRLVGLLVRHSPDVGTALRRLATHFHLVSQGVAVHLDVDGGLATLSYRIESLGMTGADQTGDGAVAAMLNILRELCGPDFRATEALFTRARPQQVEPYRSIVGVRLTFDAGANAIVFSSSWLSRPLPPTDPMLEALIREKVEEIERRSRHSFPDQVSKVVASALAFDQIRADRVAAMFGMHVRTFHRRLQASGHSYQDILDQARFAAAKRMMERPEITNEELAERLGYAELRSFHRAFKRWTGMSPVEWRHREVSR